MNRFIVLFGALALLACADASAAAPLPQDSAYQLALNLTNQDGNTQPFAARRGHVQVVSMFYTSCSMVCPMIIDTMKLTHKALGASARDRVDLVAITFDPERDDVPTLRKYAAAHKLNLQHWTLARTDANDTRQLSALLGLKYRRLPDGVFNHSSELILLDSDGRILARTSVIGRTDPEFVKAVAKAAVASATTRPVQAAAD